MKYIIGLSGKKQSGKTSSALFIKSFFEELKMSVGLYSFADGIKDICISILGLSYLDCNGDEHYKNKLSKYRKFNSNEFMTNRELMQFLGTDIFRQFLGEDVWVNNTFRKINNDNKDVSIISDVRHKNEARSIYNNNGKIIRLNRNIYKDIKDTHESENGLDSFFFDEEKTYFINNEDISENEKNKEIEKILKEYILCQ